MQKRIAFIFTRMPYGTFFVQEGLDASLAACILSDQVGIFFVSDGVFLLLSDQDSSKGYGKDFVCSFEVLLSCGVYNLYLCSDSACERGLTRQMCWISDEVVWLSSNHWYNRLLSYDVALRF